MKLVNIQKLFFVLAGLGISLLITGNILNDVQFWYIADIINGSIFAGIIIVLYVTFKKNKD